MSVRLDKWLRAARFFKTRTRARAAIDGGQVHLNGHRAKPGRAVCLGDTLRITRGHEEKIVVIRGLTENRGSASVARALYEETPESLAQRAAQRRTAGNQAPTEGRPNKKDRRLIRRFRGQH